MKKKIVTILIALVCLAFVGLGVVKTSEYYQGRYVESDIYYVYVPETQSLVINDLYDDSGKLFDRGRDYVFTGYSTEEKSRILEFSYHTEDPDKLLQPGSYLKVSVSDKIVLGQEVISESDVPEHVRLRLSEQNNKTSLRASYLV